MESQKKDFFIETQFNIDDLLIFDKFGKLICDCKKVKKVKNEKVTAVFNATTECDEMIGYLLSGKHVTEYKFNNLFSVPIENDTFKKFHRKEMQNWSNIILINAPKDINFITVEFPEVYISLWNLDKKIALGLFDIKKTKFEISNPKTSDFLKMGIDPQAEKQFVKTLELKVPSKEYLLGMDIDKVLESKIKVTCYTTYKKIKMNLNNSELEIES